MNKIVLDTNVVLSALFSNRGASFQLLEMLIEEAEQKRLHNVVSVPLVLEFEEVFLRSKNREHYAHFSDEDIKYIIADIISISYRTKLHFLWRPFLKDAFDDKVLETAVNGGAKTIVTFNIKDFDGLKRQYGIDILTPAELLRKGVLS